MSDVYKQSVTTNTEAVNSSGLLKRTTVRIQPNLVLSNILTHDRFKAWLLSFVGGHCKLNCSVKSLPVGFSIKCQWLMGEVTFREFSRDFPGSTVIDLWMTTASC